MSRAPSHKVFSLEIEEDSNRPVRQKVLDRTPSSQFQGWFVEFLACGHGLFRPSGTWADNRDCRMCSWVGR